MATVFYSMMHITPKSCRTLRERVRQGMLPLLALALSLSIAVPMSAQDIFAVDSAPKTSVRTRDWALRDFHALPDGKMLVLGSFKFVDGTLVDGMARLNADGSLDSSFTAPYSGPRITRCGVMDDGRIIIIATVTGPAGTQRLLQRLLPDGSIDPTFAAIDVIAYQPQAVFGLPDGGAYFIHQAGPNTMRVLRVLPNGQLDPAFNSAPLSGSFINAGAVGPANQLALFRNSGIGASSIVVVSSTGVVQPAFTGIQVNFRVSSSVFEPSGALVLAGASTNPAPTTGLMRILPTGARDLTFSGIVPFANGVGGSVVRLTDGTFMAAGPGTPTLPAVVHFSATGAYLGGIMSTNLAAGSTGLGLMRPSPVAGAYALGSFVALGGVPVGSIARIKADRSIDQDFLADVMGFGRMTALAPYRDGFVIAGAFTEIGEQAIANLATFGADDSFASVIPGFFPSSTARALGTSDGGVVFMGSFGGAFSPLPTAIGLLKLRPDGTINSSFAPSIPPNSAEDAVEQPDGRIIFAGRAGAGVPGSPVLNLFRLNANGSLDATFNNQSPITGGTGQGLTAVAVDAQGRVVVAGSFTTFQGVVRPGLVRLLSNGTVDPSFVPTVGLTAGRNIRFLADGSFYIAGVRTDQPLGTLSGLHRFNADGSLHAVQWSFPGLSVGTFAVHPDGSIFVSGGGSGTPAIFRILPSGEIDPLFECSLDLGTNSPVLIDELGRVIVTGVFSTVNGESHEGIVRFAPVPFGVAITGAPAYTLRLHDTLTLTAEVTGARTAPAYQWFHDGEPIAGATGPTLTLTHLVPKHEGAYTVSASGAAGTVTSAPVSLTLIRGKPVKN